MKIVATYSIVACDLERGEWGIAVQSKFLGVGAVVPWARAGVGAVATQSWANTTYGPRGLEMIAEGLSAPEVIERLVADDEHASLRQVGVVDAQGRAAAFTGEECFEWAGHVVGEHYCAQGNILVGESTVTAMAESFEESEGDLADRLVKALAAAQAAGGDRRGQQSAALLVVREGGGYGGFNDRYVDIRVDEHPRPIEELARILRLYRFYFSPSAGELIPIDAELAAELQLLLAEAGHYHGPVTGEYDLATREALRSFGMIENFESRLRDDDMIDSTVLQFIRERVGRERD